MACTGFNALDPRCQMASVAGNVASDAFSSIAQHFASATAAAVDWLWQQLDEATSVDLSSAGVNRDLAVTAAVAVTLSMALFVVQLITATLRREPGGLVRAVRGLAVAITASAFAIASTRLVLAAVDDLSAGVVRATAGTTLDGLGTRFELASGLTQLTNPAGVLLFALVILLAVVVIWAALMIRKMLIVVAAVLTPIAFAGGTADVTRGWIRRWIEFTAALVASKLLLVLMLLIGLSIFEGAGMTGGASGGEPSASQAGTQLASGAVLLLLAGLAPWAAIRMCHFAGESLHAVHAQAVAARSGLQTIVAAPRKLDSVVSQGRRLGGPSAVPTRGSAAPSAASVRAQEAMATPGMYSAGSRPGASDRSMSASASDDRTSGTEARSSAQSAPLAPPPTHEAGAAEEPSAPSRPIHAP